MSTPIEIVREMQLWRRGEGKYADIREAGAFSAIAAMPYKPEQFGEAIDAALADAERFKALERAHSDPRGEEGWSTWYDDTHNRQVMPGTLAELADRLKGTQ